VYISRYNNLLIEQETNWGRGIW